MSSIFLFSEDHTPIEQVHFNLWMVGGDEPFIDIGLRIKEGQEIVLYLPWGKVLCEDLYEKIKDEEVLNALFNQHLSVTKNTENSYFTASRNGESFDVMKAAISITESVDENEKSDENKKFTRIVIKRTISTGNDAYVRFRARGFKNNIFNKKHTVTNWGLSPYDEIIEAIDFRVNEIRTAKRSDFDNSNGFKTPAITDLHFLLLKSFRETNSLVSPNYERCRELEDDAWKKYLLSNNNLEKSSTHFNRLKSALKILKFFNEKEAILAYHWKKKIKEEEHFSVLATFIKKTVSWRVLIYIAVIILLNNYSKTIWDYLALFWDCFKQIINNIENIFSRK